MRPAIPHDASRRERQILDILYRLGRATAAEVLAEMPSAPGYSAVRAMLRTLEEKGHVQHVVQGPRYVYVPTVPVETAKKSAVRHLLDTFFDGSREEAVAAMLDAAVSEAELDRLARLIDNARKDGR
ncbi:MAG: BlaI/MecI/CopY family transcriptional regulator [Bryobacteraceae bacterium]